MPPEETEHIFYLYWHRLRDSGVTHQEIKAYEELEGIKLEPWEIDLLFAIHNVTESTIAEITKAQRKKK